MVEQFSRHSLIDVTLKVAGDLHIDQHHTTEDSAIALGQALAQALGDKGGIGRYGTAYSADGRDAGGARCARHLGAALPRVEAAGSPRRSSARWDTELVEHWFHSVAQAAGTTLHVQLLYGQNNHHLCECGIQGLRPRDAPRRRSSSTRAREGRCPLPRASFEDLSVDRSQVFVFDYSGNRVRPRDRLLCL